MASAGLKRPSDFEIGSMSDPCQRSANKRRCTTNQNYSYNVHNQTHPTTASPSSVAPSPNLASSPFKDPTVILGPLCDHVTSIIKNEVHRAHHQQQQQQQQQQPHQQNQQQHHNNHPSLPINYDEPTLSVRQTQAICEKIIREREQKLREEYDKILISKLAEQYDTFVKYTHDHIETRYNETNSHPSYLS